MKKSSILIMVLVYIVSFLVVGFLGLQTRTYNTVNYVDYIKIQIPDNDSKLVKENEQLVENTHYDYTFYIPNQPGEYTTRLEAVVYPTNSTYQSVRLTCNEYDKDPRMDIALSDDRFILITFNNVSGYAGAMFTLYSTDSQNKFTTCFVYTL